MSDAIIKDNENEFTKHYCTDDLHKQIISELSTRKPGTKGSRKINLTPQMLRDFLYYVSCGINLKNSAEKVGIEEKTRQRYNTESVTFRGVVSLAQQNIEDMALITVYKAIEGTKPGYYQLVHPVTKTTEYIAVKEVPPNVSVAQWLLEKKKTFGGDDSAGTPKLGAPRNEEEARLLEMLLNKHYDYVKAKESAK